MLFTTEIASISVGSDAAAASVASDSPASPLSSATPSDQSVGLLSQQDSSLIHLDQFRADARFNWIDGHGLSVVVIDTGINLSHSFFGNRIVFSTDFSGSNDSNASDTNGHGTNVASIIGSQDGTFTGMAPGVNIIALKVFPDGANPSASSTDIAEALNWVVTNRAAYNVVAVNMSLGSGDNLNTATASPYASQFANLAANNTAVVVASGNSYAGQQGVSSPSADPNAWSIGAVWDRNAGGPFSWSGGRTDFTTGPDRIISFSQRSTSMTTIFAPGGQITGAGLGSGTLTESGTSQAAPHVAGLVADMQQLAMSVSGHFLSVAQLKQDMFNGAASIFDGDDENDSVTNTFASYRRVDALGWANSILTDLFAGTAGNDTLAGTVVGDTIHGAAGNDSLNGLGGNDTLFGDAGNDFLNGGTGNDSLFGGTGADTFFLAPGLGMDTVMDFSHVEGDKVDLSSVASIHNLAQVLYRSTQVGTDTVVDLFGGDQLTLKGISRASLLASDFALLSATTIEAIGATTLTQVANTYFLDAPNGAPSPQLRFGGAAVTTAQLGSWTPIGAEVVGGNYQVVVKNGAANQYAVWFTDSNGNFQSSTAVVSGSSWVIQGLEIPFGQNLNGDGQIGPTMSNVESAGVTRLVSVADSYFMYQGGGTSGPQLKVSGSYFMAGQFGAWTPLGAEVVQGNYQVVLKNGGADQYVVWFTDNNGNYQASTGMLAGASYTIQALEVSFGQDFNSNGQMGPTTTTIESIGATTLARVADSYFLYNHGTTTGPQLKINGTYASTGQLGFWAPIGAEQVNGSYQIVFQNGVANQYVVWFADSSGNYQASTAMVTGSSWLVQGLEIGFGQNLNSDGQLGPVTSNIEAAGVTRLVQRADSYFMYQGGGTSGPQLKMSGMYVAAGQFGAWTPRGAEQNGNASGYQLVFQNGNTDQYVLWNTDNDGNVTSSGAVMSGSTAGLKALEVAFHQDFNSNGTIGTGEPAVDSGETMNFLFGSANATGAGSSGSANLALLTNYMASTFVPPAGEGTGVVAGAQSSAESVLAKPSA